MSATETTLLAVRRLLRDFTHDAPPWRARSVRYAAVLVMLGVGLGIWRATTGEPGAGPGLDPSSWPWPTRLGISWIGGFGVGWTMRRFMKLTLLALLAAFALFYLLRYLGLDQGTWAQLQQAVTAGLDEVRAEAGVLERIIKSSLPSAASASLGGLLGFFYRVRADDSPAHTENRD